MCIRDRPVRRHIVVKLDALPRLADLVGGIEVDVPKRMYYVDRSQNLQIDLQPGRQILRGRELIGFLRWRSDTRGDLGVWSGRSWRLMDWWIASSNHRIWCAYRN